METFKLVMPEDLNPYGYLFGGRLLSWVDEYSYIAARLDFPTCNLVTVALDSVEFRKSVGQGVVLRFQVDRVGLGTTSVQYAVTVVRADTEDTVEDPVFSTTVTYVRVDDSGAKVPLPELRQQL